MTSPDFSHLQDLQVSADKTAEFTFFAIKGEPVLTVAPATEANKPYFNAILKRTRSTARRMKASGGLNAALLAQNRMEDCELYSKFIVRGWSKVQDKAGKAVPFSAEACLEFLKAIPSYMLDELRNFCAEQSNFLDEDESTPEGLEELSGK